MFKTFEGFVETFIFKSRWLLAPLYIGLVTALIVLIIEFIQGIDSQAVQHDYLIRRAGSDMPADKIMALLQLCQRVPWL